MLASTPGFTAQAIKEADRRGWRPAWFMSYVNADDMLFQFVSPELLEGTISFQAFKLADWKDDPAVARHYELMRQYGGPAPANFTLYGQLLMRWRPSRTSTATCSWTGSTSPSPTPTALPSRTAEC
jgi:hypothetical protein